MKNDRMARAEIRGQCIVRDIGRIVMEKPCHLSEKALNKGLDQGRDCVQLSSKSKIRCFESIKHEQKKSKLEIQGIEG